MKVYNILDIACALIGSPVDESLKKAGVGLVNTILADLSLHTVCFLTDEIKAEPSYTTVISNGVAMLLCIYLGDDAGASAMSELYNSLRSQLLKGVGKIKNTAFGSDSL